MPVADKNGTALIIKIKLIRPPDSAWHTPPRQYARVKAYSMLPLKSLRVLPAKHRTRKLPQKSTDRADAFSRSLQASLAAWRCCSLCGVPRPRSAP
jgi:hypothetical protein